MLSALALVTARGGSKGIPGKNLVSLGDRPLIAWTLEAARASRIVRRTLVSTDSPHIAEVAREWGGWVPFLRPAALGADHTPSRAVVADAVGRLEADGALVEEWLVLLQPTSPFRTGRQIDEALTRAERMGAEAVIGVRPARDPPAWLLRVDPSGYVRQAFPELDPADRRQDLDPMVFPCGALYAVRTHLAKEGRLWLDVPTLGFMFSGPSAVDIDEPLDLEWARQMVEGGLVGREEAP